MPKGDYPPEPLTVDEVKALLQVCGGDSLSAVRTHALMVVLWRGGLRIGEALSLKPSDVDWGAGTVRILHTKTRRARTVGLDDAALAVLSAWVEARRAAEVPGDVLFCRLHGQPGERLSAEYVRAQMERLAVKAGVKHRVRPHQFRHSHAVELRREGWPVPEIARQLGHSSIATTQVYIDHLYPSEVIDRARARTW